MNVLFLTISKIDSINSHGIYKDLMRKFRDEGHQVFIVTPVERKTGQKTVLIKIDGVSILKVKTLNLKKTNVFEKGIGTLMLEHQFLHAINKKFSHHVFDLLLYSTPPITVTKIVKKIKKRDGAMTYLMLKDIFPQNAVDLEMIKVNSLLHKYFRSKEEALYSTSDYIGCMSPANVSYLMKHNPQIDPQIVEVNPNSIEPSKIKKDDGLRKTIRAKFNLPEGKTIFIYGGNLGKAQGIDFLLETINVCSKVDTAFFVIVGNGTEYLNIQHWFSEKKPKNAMLIKGLSKQDYDDLLKACDVGLIFLDRHFTIPNYPSRLLAYLENSMPIIAATDPHTDIGAIAVENGYGLCALSGDVALMKEYITSLACNNALIKKMGKKGYQFLLQNYTVEQSYSKIMAHFS